MYCTLKLTQFKKNLGGWSLQNFPFLSGFVFFLIIKFNERGSMKFASCKLLCVKNARLL